MSTLLQVHLLCLLIIINFELVKTDVLVCVETGEQAGAVEKRLGANTNANANTNTNTNTNTVEMEWRARHAEWRQTWVQIQIQIHIEIQIHWRCSGEQGTQGGDKFGCSPFWWSCSLQLVLLWWKQFVKGMCVYKILLIIVLFGHPRTGLIYLRDWLGDTLPSFIPDFYNKTATEPSENQNPRCAPIMPNQPSRQTVQDPPQDFLWHLIRISIPMKTGLAYQWTKQSG